jgi:hypothetical protein
VSSKEGTEPEDTADGFSQLGKSCLVITAHRLRLENDEGSLIAVCDEQTP